MEAGRATESYLAWNQTEEKPANCLQVQFKAKRKRFK